MHSAPGARDPPRIGGLWRETMRKKVACFSLLVVFAGAPNIARADPLTLNAASFFSFDIEGNFYRFAGDSFDLQQAGLGVSFPIVTEGEPCQFDCRAGDFINGVVHSAGEVDLGSGRGVIEGVEFSSLTFRGSLEFRVGPQVFPDTAAFTVPLATPFVFNGAVRAFAGDTEVFSHDLQGEGTRVGTFIRHGDTFTIGEHAITYLFDRAAPTPEPSTMLLVGPGALAIARWRRRRV
jgi:hypothetical protein